MAGFWGRRKREQDAATAAQDAELSHQAGRALVDVDERIRVTTEELEFAEAELGPAATQGLRDALGAVRTHLGEAFHLNQLNHDEIPDTVEELRTRNARIVQLCAWADDLLDERTAALSDAVERVRRAPEVLAGVRTSAETLRSRIPGARESVERLAARYAPSALAQVQGAPDEASQVLDFALHSADVSSRRRAAGNAEEANLALEAATESVRRAQSLLDGVDDFEIEALRAESTLADVIADSRGDIVRARNAPATPEVAAATSALEAALSALPPTGTKTDPFRELTRLREANTALDDVIAKAQARAANPLPSPDLVRHAIDDADRQLAIAANVISSHRGYIGPDARTRLAEAERTRAEIDALPSGEESREPALRHARRTAQLASEALALAQRDIDNSRGNDWGGGWGGRGGRGGGMGDAVGGILGGLVIGGLIGDIFD
ncbi:MULTISPECIES: hypothetical protein [Microbacterium]|jgi:hypothetical protein|uniref:Uncharacterized protein n=1 Tax=Acrobeloides nanus TaxID=290746 RepID=A0A914CQW0_9BILA|nr:MULTISPECIES: hypothetical protein [unclassified Microbacterium]MBN9198609.1 hypothetical protein [Microbacterium ginsengisoli]MCK9914928.1 hypothetical protein [Microbacteriaceae bacterium K1510]KQS00160.1 hypothetical protein ASF93_11950 [Microbacterium sp. Leaf347]KQS02809.1 hypothetical protein ASG00_08955 [Microbacterium sp. Leaf351]OJU77674.1 MAG: hypothetical protein BGO15_11745 [Microbacterium sp. 71-23]